MGWYSESEIKAYYLPAPGWGFATYYPGDMIFYAQWKANSYTVTYNSGNLLYGLDDVSSATGQYMTYSISNKVVTVTASRDDGYGITTGRVYLTAGVSYTFTGTSSGNWGYGSDVEALFLLNGTYDLYYSMSSTTTFTPSTTGLYYLRLDVNTSGATHTFSNLTVSYTVQTATKSYGSQLGTLPSPTYSEHSLVGWYTGMNGTGTQISSTTTVPANNVTYYAYWSKSTFIAVADPNGGTIPTTTGWTAVSGHSTATKNVVYGSTYGTLPTPTRTGYTFNGWYSLRGLGTISLATSTQNWNYKVLWDEIYPGTTYTITISSATLTSGTATQFATLIYDFTTDTTLETKYMSFGSNLSYTITCPSSATASHDIELLVYAGVNGSTSGNATTYSDVKIGNSTLSAISSTSTVSTANSHTLFADWVPISYTISYTLNSGTISGQKTSYTIETESFTLPTPTRSGYTFTGWTGSNGTTPQTTVTISKGSTGNKAYTANWRVNNYQITRSGTTIGYQDTLANAVSTASTAGDVIIVLNSITDSSSPTISRNLTLNTNGKTLTRTGATNITGGTLTVNGSGTITREYTASCYQLFYANGGSMSITSVTMNESSTAASSSCTSSLIKNAGSGTITVGSGASITSARNTIILGGAGTITLSGGTIAGTSTYNTVYGAEGATGTINVSGATVTATSSTDYAISTGNAAASSTINITSGTVSGTYYAVDVGGKFNMSGGTVKITTTSTDTKYYAVKVETTGTATITGGGLTSPSYGRVVSVYGSLILNGSSAYIYNSSTSLGVGIRVEGTSGVLHLAAGKIQTVGGQALYVLDSGTAYLNYETNYGKGLAYDVGLFVASKSANAIYGTTSASVYFGTLTYKGASYSPTVITGGSDKYAFWCGSGVTICDYRGGRLFHVTKANYANANITLSGGTPTTASNTGTWNGAVSGYGLSYSYRTVYSS